MATKPLSSSAHSLRPDVVKCRARRRGGATGAAPTGPRPREAPRGDETVKPARPPRRRLNLGAAPLVISDAYLKEAFPYNNPEDSLPSASPIEAIGLDRPTNSTTVP